MKLSVIVIFHNMRREAVRTLFSLSRKGQSGIDGLHYEVIAIDNGSDEPLQPGHFEHFRNEITHVKFDTGSVSPVGAVNAGARMAKGDLIAVIVDGARMASPGLIRQSLLGASLAKEPFVCALSWHLGPAIQNESMLTGYGQIAEDALLTSIGWPLEGYRLFEISTIAPSSREGFFSGVPPECSWFCMKRSTFLELGGFEVGFQSPGGGLVNHDFRNRAIGTPSIQPVVVLGEGVFHQFHGGVATNVPLSDHPWRRFEEEYINLRGKAYEPSPSPEPLYVGTIPSQARRFLF